MALGQTQYFYTVELSALEEQLGHSIDRITRLREKAIKRSDLKTADQINQLQRSLDVAMRRVTRLK
jgi:DNA mismatch repair ATPase MutS